MFVALMNSIMLELLRIRFKQHPERHAGIMWGDVEDRLRADPAHLRTLHAMEESGGEPDVVVFSDGELYMVDCAAESPVGRRSLCFDPAALASRKANKPVHSAVGMAEEMGLTLLSQEQYRFLQSLGEFDHKTSSWVDTPADIRAQGGALFGDRRFGAVFIYHNGAESYYGARGFRGYLKLN